MDEHKKFSWGRKKKVKLEDKWIKDENGENVEAAFLCNASQLDMNELMTINMLEAFGIPCISTMSEHGTLGKVFLGITGEAVGIYVPITMLEDAKALIEGVSEDEDI